MTPIPCRKHPVYLATTPPASGCPHCWRFWHFTQRTDFRALNSGRRAYSQQQIAPDRKDRP